MNPKETLCMLLFILNSIILLSGVFLIDKMFKLNGDLIGTPYIFGLILLNVLIIKLYDRYHEKMEEFFNKNIKVLHVIFYVAILLLLLVTILPHLIK